MTRNEERERAVLAYMDANRTFDGWFRMVNLEGWRWGGQVRRGVMVGDNFLNAAAIKTALARLEKKGLVVSEPVNGYGGKARRWRTVEP